MEKDYTPAVIQQMYDLLIWLMERVEGFPRSSRYVLGDRILRSALFILRRLITARFNTYPSKPLRRANLELDQLRYLMRISMDRKFIAPKQYAFASEKMTEVGKQIGGWLKSAESRPKGGSA